MFGIAFEKYKSAFNTKKFIWRKKYSLDKKIISNFKGLKSLKMTKTYFWQKLKNETFAKKCFFT